MLHRLKRYERRPRESFLNRGVFPSPALRRGGWVGWSVVGGWGAELIDVRF
jgi:hypothetical protein